MAVWKASAIIDVIFIILYGILFILNLFNCYLHRLTDVGNFALLRAYVLLLFVSACWLPKVATRLTYS